MTEAQKQFYLSNTPPLTEEEKEAALFEGLKKKFYRLKNQEYWKQQESIKKDKK